MAWPPPTFPINYDNTTPQQDTHPDAHNQVNQSLNADFRPRIDKNTADIASVESDLAAHTANIVPSRDGDLIDDLFIRLEQVANNTITHFGEWPALARVSHGIVFVRQLSEVPDTIFPFARGGITALSWLKWFLVDGNGDIVLRPRVRQVAGFATYIQQGQQTNHIAAMVRRSDENSNFYIQSGSSAQQRTVGADVNDPSPLETGWERLWVNLNYQLT